MLAKTESESRLDCENSQKQHFEIFRVRPSRTDYCNIPQVDWACPPQFLVNPNWKMEDGSESQESHSQLQRESRIAEAIYYRASEIPLNPYVASNAHDFSDGSEIPVIPIDVISDDTSPGDPLISVGLTVERKEKVDKATQPILERDEVIGNAVALMALIKSRGSQIDFELLIQLLCNPGMLDQLMKEHGLLANPCSVITRTHPDECLSVPLPVPAPAGGSHSTWSPSTPFTHSMSQGVKDMVEQIHSRSESQNPFSNKKVDLGELRKLINEYGVQLGDDSIKPGPALVKDVDYHRRVIEPIKPGPAMVKEADYYRRVIELVEPEPAVVKDAGYCRRLIEPVKPGLAMVKDAGNYRRVIEPVEPEPDVVKDADYCRKLIEPVKLAPAMVKDADYYRRLMEPVEPVPAVVKDADYCRRLLESVKPESAVVKDADHYRRVIDPVKPGPIVVNDADQCRRLNKPAKSGSAVVKDADYYSSLIDPVKPGSAMIKDADYYRRLISLHGMMRDDCKPEGSVNPTGSRKRRPCVYFNSPKGCRDGPSCRFQHVKEGLGAGSRTVENQHGARRLKLSGENFARHT